MYFPPPKNIVYGQKAMVFLRYGQRRGHLSTQLQTKTAEKHSAKQKKVIILQQKSI